jgi:exonuclease V gamma subunit
VPARLHFSNSLDALAERLRKNLDRESRDPFMTQSIATPASALRDWLKVRLAESAGVAAGLSFPHLENLLWERLAERDRHRDAADRQPARQLDSFGFQGLVLARLRHKPPEDVRHYLESSEAEDSARRECQLAGRLASLFREYEYNRVAEHGFAGVA